MLIKNPDKPTQPDMVKGSGRLVSSIPEHALSVKEHKKVLEHHARVGQFRADRKLEYEKVDGAVVMRQFIGDRTLRWSTDTFRKGWERIWGK